MNLPSLTRAALATGLLSVVLVPSLPGALTPAFLKISTTTFNVGAITSGAATRSSGHLYFAGGHAGNTHFVTKAVKKVDLLTKSVTNVAPLPTALAGLGLVEFETALSTGALDLIYAIGGIDGTGHVQGTVQIYNPATDTWSPGADMPTPRAYLAVVAGTDGKIYAIGGTGENGKPLATVESYNPVTNTWAEEPSLLIARTHLAAVLGPLDVIYVEGGIDAGGNYQATSELFSEGSAAWVLGFSMNVARSDFGLSMAGDGFIHAVGGLSSSGPLKSIEAYNPATGAWTIEENALPAPQAKLVSVEGLDGSDYFLGGDDGSKVYNLVKQGTPPAYPSHNYTFFMHGVDEPVVNGTFSMDSQVPLNQTPLLELTLLSNTFWGTFPALTGTIGAGGTLTLNVPATLGLGLGIEFTVYATDLDGGSSQVLGSTFVLLALNGQINLPITTPLTLKNQVLVLSINPILGLNLDFAGGDMYIQLSDFDGIPSVPLSN